MGVYICVYIFTVQNRGQHIYHTGHGKWSEVRSGVVACVEFGQEVCGARCLRLVEIAHDVCLLLPDVDGLLELHLPLNDQHVNHAGIIHVLVSIKHLSHFISSLSNRDV